MGRNEACKIINLMNLNEKIRYLCVSKNILVPQYGGLRLRQKFCKKAPFGALFCFPLIRLMQGGTAALQFF